MALYAIGDLQGCSDPLKRILDAIHFDSSRDRLWFVGDLVNRGPDSLGCLRFVKSLGDVAVAVLGNHDFHLLCSAEALVQARPRDALGDVLEAPDREELLDWLRHRPLMHVEGDYAMVHAGLLPEWTVPKARELAGEVEAELQGPRWRRFLAHLYGNEPDRWRDDLAGYERLRAIVNAMARLRVCSPEGRMDLKFHGEPGEHLGRRVPWFRMPGRASTTHTVVCGHWSALGLHMGDGVLALDTGCVWGGCLTAIRLGDRRLYQARCPAGRAPAA
jgi:bis(5'-nucleosyl)-tetraphosphatase (symmetrical)